MSEPDLLPETEPSDEATSSETETVLILDDASVGLMNQIMQAIGQSDQEAVSMAAIPPLDLTATASFDPAIYGITAQHQTGTLVNCWVKVLPGLVNEPSGVHTTQMTRTRVGTVLAQNKDKVVVRMSNAFIGWLPPDRYALANIVVPDTPTWTH